MKTEPEKEVEKRPINTFLMALGLTIAMLTIPFAIMGLEKPLMFIPAIMCMVIGNMILYCSLK